MDTNPISKRRWFQIHLSTCVLLMFVAGGIIGLNIQKVQNQMAYGSAECFVEDYRFIGWPEPFYRGRKEWHFPNYGIWEESYIAPANAKHERNLLVGGMFIDVAVALIILFAVAFPCEFFIRRRASRSRP